MPTAVWTGTLSFGLVAVPVRLTPRPNRRTCDPTSMTVIQGFRFGQLRHTGATLALEAGANLVLVASRLGHTSTRMLEQHYAGRLDRATENSLALWTLRHGCGTSRCRATATRT